MKTKHDRPKMGDGFTLVELLVVLAIISILMALLLPSLKRAKWAAKQVVCINNLHQLHIGLLLYVNDWDGYFPVANPNDGGVPDYDYWGWTRQLARYTNVKTNSISAPFVPITSVFWCPVPASGVLCGTAERWQYAMNEDLRQNGHNPVSDWYYGSRAVNLVNINQVRDPAAVFAFTENGYYPAVLNQYFLENGLYGDSVSISTAGPAHGGKGLPFIYVDGHAIFWNKVPSYATYTTDSKLPWTHSSFWGREVNGYGAQWATYDP